ncbi:MAG: antitoxin MazE [Planctomycetota bacterium]|jgi:antitoxin MazE
MIDKVYTLYMKTKLLKWGNSSGIRLPKQVVDTRGLLSGSDLSLEIKDNSIILKPISNKKETIEDLVALMHSQNMHAAIDWGSDRGAEHVV